MRKMIHDASLKVKELWARRLLSQISGAWQEQAFPTLRAGKGGRFLQIKMELDRALLEGRATRRSLCGESWNKSR